MTKDPSTFCGAFGAIQRTAPGLITRDQADRKTCEAGGDASSSDDGTVIGSKLLPGRCLEETEKGL